jgi:hypothetical protein
MHGNIGFRLVILLSAAALLSCRDRASGIIDASPECRIDGSNKPCCVDDRVCEVHPQSGYYGPAVATSLDALCGVGPCEPDLEAAVTSPACSFVRVGCGLTEVNTFLHGLTFTSVYDSETGELVGARSVTTEGETSKVDGCCGADFRAGVTPGVCAEVTDGACTENP